MTRFISINNITNNSWKSDIDDDKLSLSINDITSTTLKYKNSPYILADGVEISIGSTQDDARKCVCSETSKSCCYTYKSSITDVTLTSSGSGQNLLYCIAFTATNLISISDTDAPDKVRPSFSVIAGNSANAAVINLDNENKMKVNDVEVVDTTDNYVRNGKISLYVKSSNLNLTPTYFKVFVTTSYKWDNIKDYFSTGDTYGMLDVQILSPLDRNGYLQYSSPTKDISSDTSNISKLNTLYMLPKKVHGKQTLYYRHDRVGKFSNNSQTVVQRIGGNGVNNSINNDLDTDSLKKYALMGDSDWSAGITGIPLGKLKLTPSIIQTVELVNDTKIETSIITSKGSKHVHFGVTPPLKDNMQNNSFILAKTNSDGKWVSENVQYTGIQTTNQVISANMEINITGGSIESTSYAVIYNGCVEMNFKYTDDLGNIYDYTTTPLILYSSIDSNTSATTVTKGFYTSSSFKLQWYNSGDNIRFWKFMHINIQDSKTSTGNSVQIKLDKLLVDGTKYYTFKRNIATGVSTVPNALPHTHLNLKIGNSISSIKTAIEWKAFNTKLDATPFTIKMPSKYVSDVDTIS